MLETEVKKLNKNLELLNTNFATLFASAGLSTADPIEEAELAAAEAAIQPATEQPVQQSIPQMQQPVQQHQVVQGTAQPQMQQPMTQQIPQQAQQQQPMTQQIPQQAQQLPITQQQPVTNNYEVQNQVAQAPVVDPALSNLMIQAAQVSGDALLLSKLLGQLGVNTVEQLDINGLTTLQANLTAIIANAQGGAH